MKNILFLFIKDSFLLFFPSFSHEIRKKNIELSRQFRMMKTLSYKNYLIRTMTTTLHEFSRVVLTACKLSSLKIKEFSEKLCVQYKSDGSEVTQVDVYSQRLSLSIIKRSYPTVNIIGEEESIELLPSEEIPSLSPDFHFPFDNKPIDINDIVIYIDPLDGTSCYVKKEYKGVSVLIGVTYKGKPFLGCIAQPFIDDNVLFGVENFVSSYNELCGESDPINHAINDIKQVEGDTIRMTCSKRNDISKFVTNFPDKYSVTFRGGSGSKMVSIIKGEEDIYYHPFKISCCWDTLAGHVIIEAFGGIVTDIHGNDLVYPSSKKTTMRHENGVLCMSKRSKKYLDYFKSLNIEL